MLGMPYPLLIAVLSFTRVLYHRLLSTGMEYILSFCIETMSRSCASFSIIFLLLVCHWTHFLWPARILENCLSFRGLPFFAWIWGKNENVMCAYNPKENGTGDSFYWRKLKFLCILYYQCLNYLLHLISFSWMLGVWGGDVPGWSYKQLPQFYNGWKQVFPRWLPRNCHSDHQFPSHIWTRLPFTCG